MRQGLLDLMTNAALTAGEIILDLYSQPFESRAKADGTPVTEADQRAEDAILAALAATGLPVLAEESVAGGQIPNLGERYFVVDPLDGTKEFIKRNDEFTVNIALVEHGRPVLGVVTAPALHKGYAGEPEGATAFAIADGKATDRQPIGVAPDRAMRVVASRSHGHAALTDLCAHFNVVEDVSVGSSLKFCMVACGEARFYPRLTPTCEWDTAAGQAVLEAAGGVVLTLDGKRLGYGKVDKRFLNPHFVAADATDLAAATARRMNEILHT